MRANCLNSIKKLNWFLILCTWLNYDNFESINLIKNIICIKHGLLSTVSILIRNILHLLNETNGKQPTCIHHSAASKFKHMHYVFHNSNQCNGEKMNIVSKRIVVGK